MNRHRGRRLTAMAAVLVVVFAACSSGGGNKTAGKAAKAKTAGSGGVLRYGYDFAVPFLDDMGDPGRMGIMASPKATDLNSHPIGTGPFVFQSYSPGAKISIRRNPNYWGTKPKLAGIDYIQIGTGPPAVTALRSGAVDLIRFEPESYSTLKANKNVQVVAQPTGAYLQMQFRLGPSSPFSDV